MRKSRKYGKMGRYVVIEQFRGRYYGYEGGFNLCVYMGGYNDEK